MARSTLCLFLNRIKAALPTAKCGPVQCCPGHALREGPPQGREEPGNSVSCTSQFPKSPGGLKAATESAVSRECAVLGLMQRGIKVNVSTITEINVTRRRSNSSYQSRTPPTSSGKASCGLEQHSERVAFSAVN